MKEKNQRSTSGQTLSALTAGARQKSIGRPFSSMKTINAVFLGFF